MTGINWEPFAFTQSLYQCENHIPVDLCKIFRQVSSFNNAKILLPLLLLVSVSHSHAWKVMVKM